MAELNLSAMLQALEERLLQPSIRRSRTALEALLEPEFREFGSSGRVFDREAIFLLLQTEASAPSQAQLHDFLCTPLAADVALVTYRSLNHMGSEALRSSLWCYRDGHWQLLFHQGTRVISESVPTAHCGATG